MGNKGKLAAVSFIAGAAAAIYASNQMKKSILLHTTAENYRTQRQNYSPTTAESNNFFIKAPNIGTDNNIGVTSKTNPYNNLYFENIPNSESISNNFISKSENDTAFLNTALKIDSW